jgi:acyl-CoA thioester hydrolase
MEHHRKLVYSNQMPIRWGDQDAMGHVNNTVYFRYMEQTRIEWLESFGFGTSVTQTEGPVIVNASCTFLVPGHLSWRHRVPDVLRPSRAQQRADLLRDARRRRGSPLCRRRGESWCGSIPGTGKSIPLPEPMRAACL